MRLRPRGSDKACPQMSPRRRGRNGANLFESHIGEIAFDNPVWPTLIFRFELDSFVRTAQITDVQGEAFNDYVCCLHGVYIRLPWRIDFFARDRNTNEFE